MRAQVHTGASEPLILPFLERPDPGVGRGRRKSAHVFRALLRLLHSYFSVTLMSRQGVFVRVNL